VPAIELNGESRGRRPRLSAKEEKEKRRREAALSQNNKANPVLLLDVSPTFIRRFPYADRKRANLEPSLIYQRLKNNLSFLK